MTYNVKPAVKAAFVILAFVALAGCEEPTKANSGQQPASASNCNCNTVSLRQAQESKDYVPAPARRRVVVHAVTRASGHIAGRVAGRVASRSSTSSYSSSSSYAESEYYSSSYTSQSSVSGSSSSYSSGAYGYSAYGHGGSGSVKVARASVGATGWVDGFGKHYAVGQSYGAGYPEYHDGGPGAAYLDVVTDDRSRANPWHGYNFRQGPSSGY